jgi:UDP-N-acetylmuramoylalanine--D-glutamate ligase
LNLKYFERAKQQMNFSGKRVLILGLGETGMAMAQWLLRCGASLRVADTRSTPDRLPALLAVAPDVEFVAGEFGADLLDGVDAVAVSPGLSPLRELAALIPAANEKQIPVWSEIELFAQALADLKESQNYAPKIIAITGTNGKTTVTSMVGLLCARSGVNVKIAGNISPAALDVLRHVLETDALPHVWVLELSSFQLHTTYSLQADAATVLNLTQDHLDWHGDLSAYAKDKARIFGDNTVQVLNRDDALVMAMAKPNANVVTFGTSAPQEAGDFGLLTENDMVWLAAAAPSEEAEGSSRRKKKVVEEPVLVSRLMPADALQIRGQHNATNALAALALCRAIGIPYAPLLHGLREYKGEPHRVELVASVAGVDYIDDSKGTNVGATVAALKGIGAASMSSNKRVILIAGGEGKGQDFSPLAAPVAEYAKAVLLIGKDAETIRAALTTTDVPLHGFSTLESAVNAAAALASEGDIVLLSPACASLDMFRNYAHRAQVFVDAVHEVAMARGEVI